MRQLYLRVKLLLCLCLVGYITRAQLPYTETFRNSTAPGIVFGGSPSAYLTAPSIDNNGAGYLRLTSGTTYQQAYIYSSSYFPATQGLEITFEYYIYGAGTSTGKGDGITFFLFDASVDTFKIGAYGGSLGYAQYNTPVQNGLSKAYLGVGIDEYGNFSNPTEGRQGGPGRIANSITLRGAGNGIAQVSTNYPFLTTAAVTNLTGGSRTDTTSSYSGYRKVTIDLVPRSGGGYNVSVALQIGSTTSPIITNYAYTTAAPTKVGIGLASSTGGATQYHEVRNIRVALPTSAPGLTAPTANNDAATTCQGVSATINVTANDVINNVGGDWNYASIDLDPSTSGIQQTKTTTAGTFTVNSSNGVVTFAPVSTFSGIATCQYTVQDNYGSPSSNAATITVTVQPAIAANTLTAPSATTFCASGTPGAITGSTPTGGSGTYAYQWQSSTDGSTYTNISGATSPNYTPPALAAAGSYYYRRNVTSGSCTAANSSSPVVFTVQSALGNNTVTAPATTTFCASGAPGSITGSTPSGGSGTYAYQWQSSTDGTTYTNISGATSQNYTPPALSTAGTYYYRRQVTSGACATASNSNAVTITVQAATGNNTVTAPATTTFCTSGDPETLSGSTPTGGSGTFAYQWQSSTDGTTYSNISGATSASYDPPAVSTTTYFRRQVTSGACTAGSSSNIITISIQTTVANNTITGPATASFCGPSDPGSITGSTPTGGDGTNYTYQWQGSTDGTTYSNISGAVAASYDPSTLTQTTYFRRMASSGSCTTPVASNVVIILIQPVLDNNTVTAPGTVTFCTSGDPANIVGSTPTGGSGTYVYQWQSATDGTNYTNISGATAASYDPPAVSATTYFRRQVISGACTTPSNSNVVTITIQPVVANNTITAPATTTFCSSGDPAVISGSIPAGGDGATYLYQWQSSADGITYSNISGAASASYDPPVVTATTYFRRAVTSGSCATASLSNVVTVTIQPALAGNTLNTPATTTFCGNGDPGTFSGSTPTGGSGTVAYQWQSSADGTTFTDISGATAAGYAPGVVAATIYYRRNVTSGSCSTASSSNVIVITIQPVLANNTVTAPATTTFCGSGTPAQVTGSTPTGGSGSYMYQWQLSTDGSSYSNISGATGQSYTPGALSAAGTYYYRRLVTSGSCTTASQSNAVSFTVQAAIAANTVTSPATITFCGSGDPANIIGATPTGGSGSYTYQWQSSTDGTTYTNISGATSASYDPPVVGATTYYRRQVTSGACATPSSSNVVTITIQAAVAANTITAPATTSFCASGTPGQITGSTPTGGDGSTYTYQWQSSADGTTYTNITSGGTAQNYTPPAFTAAGTYYYRRLVTSGSCTTASQSNAISFTVQAAVANNTVSTAGTTTFCGSGDPAVISATAPTGGDGANYSYQWQSSTDGTTYTDISGAASATYDPPVIGATAYYRRLVTSGSCTPAAVSNAVQFIVQPALANNTITAPATTSYCGSGTPGTITGSAATGGDGSNYAYQWQSSTDGTTYTNISGATGSNYSPSAAITQTTYYRRLVTSGSCTLAAVSNAVTITVQAVVANNTLTAPATTTFCGSGTPGTITGSTPAGGSGTYAYQWQSSTDGSTYANISGATSASYSPVAISTTTYYRRLVTSGACTSANASTPVTITVQPAIAANTLTALATTAFCGSGTPGIITGSTPTGGNGTYTYQWQASTDGGSTYTNISGATSQNYNPGTVTQTTTYIRWVSSGACTTPVGSNAVTITVQAAVANNTLTAPATTTFCGSGDAAVITGTTPTGGDGSTYTYQWQSSTDGGNTFSNISGATSASYDPPAATQTTSYRRLVTSGTCTTPAVSNVVSITIEAAIANNTLTAPATTSFCGSGDPAVITGSTPTGGNGTYTYQWQSAADGTTFTNIGGATSASYDPAAITATTYFRRVVTSGSCTSGSASAAVVFTVQAAIAGNSVTPPATTTFCASGDPANIAGSTPTGGDGTNYTYTWQSSTDGTNYTAISGATAASYDPPVITQTTYFRRLVTSGSCTTAAVSNVVTITVLPAIAGNTVTAPATTTFCASGDPANIVGSTPAGGTGAYSYQWQGSADGTTFANITGATSASYDPPAVSATTYYRRLVTSGTCTTPSVSNVVTITLQPALAGNTITAPTTTTFCASGDPDALSGSTPSGGSGTYTYQWQSSTDGTTYTNISGATSVNYDPGVLTATTYFRRLVTSGSCTTASAGNVVTITVQPAISNNTITAPATTTFCSSGTPGAITGSTPAGGSGTFVYQWQTSTDGSTYSNISGATSASYTPPALNTAGTYYYRRLVTSGSCATPSVSGVVTITVQAAVANNSITAPAPTTFCGGGDAASITGSTPTGGSGTYTYQWQRSTDGTSFTNISGATSGSYDPPSATTTTYYRRLASSGNCSAAVSNVVQVTIQPAVANNTVSANGATTVCGSLPAGSVNGSLPTGGDGTYSYQWEYSNDNGATYLPVTEGAGTSQNYTYPAIAASGTPYLRRSVTSGVCAASYSDPVIYTIQPAVATGKNTPPATTAFCSAVSSGTVITGGAVSGGNGSTYTYQWQSSTDNVNFTNIASGGGSANYTVPTTVTGTMYFRRSVVSGSCTTPVFGDTTAITVVPGPTTANAGPNQTLHNTTTATLNANTPASGNGSWTQVSGPNSAQFSSTTNPGATVSSLVSGTYVFRWSISTGSPCAASTADVTVTILAAPVANNDASAAITGVPITINILGNDIAGSAPFSSGVVITIVQGSANGSSIIVNGDNTISYVSVASGGDNFTYTITDANGAVSNGAIVTINSNSPPTANNDTASTSQGVPVAVNVPANDHDADGTLNLATVTIVSPASNGSLSVNTSTGVVTYTPNPSFYGTDVATYTINDNQGAASNVATIQFFVNARPVAQNEDTTTTVNTALVINAAKNDSDPDGTVVPASAAIATNPAHGTATSNGDGTFTYTPAIGYFGDDQFTYTISDNKGLASTAGTVTVHVYRPPVAVNDNASLNENGSATAINVLSNDSSPEGFALNPASVTITTQPQHGTLTQNNTTGVVSYTPMIGYYGNDNFQYTVKDSIGQVSNIATVNLAINATPVALNDDSTVYINAVSNIHVLTNDSDPDGTLNAASVTVVGSPAHGTATANADGTITYTPATGYTGKDQFTYTVNDNLGATSNAAIVNVTIDAPPVAVDDNATLNQGVTTNIRVTANDSDPDGTLNQASLVLVTTPSHGTATPNSDGSFTYVPNTTYSGSDNFTYTVQDNNGQTSNIATVNITINSKPVAVADNVTVNQDTPTPLNVLGNDTDGSGTILPSTVTITTQPAHGTVSRDPATGMVTYTPNPGYYGPDNFAYTVADNNGAVSAPGTVTMRVNAKPTALPDNAVATENSTGISIPVSSNDADPDGTIDPATVVVTQPAHGTATTNPDGTVTYVPAAGYLGADQFTYTVKDNNGLVSNTATVNITVNAPPVAVNDNALTNLNTAVTVAVTANDSDPDGTINAATATVSTNGANGTAVPGTTASTFVYTPNTGFTGTDQFTYTVKDNNGAISNIATVTITVNAPPVAVNDAATVNPGVATTIPVTANDYDTDGSLNNNSIVIVTQPTHGAVSVGSTPGTINYTPGTGYAGADSFTYTITDNNGATSNVAMVAIMVNAPPVAKNDSAATVQSTAVTLNITANDTDADGMVDNATVTITQQPAHGTLAAGTTAGSYVYTPDNNFYGTDNFTYTVKDNNGAVSNLATAAIIVSSTPVAGNDNIAATENTPATVNLLANDYSPGGALDSSSITIAGSPAHGTVAPGSTPGTYIYTPTPNYYGADVFSYTVKDKNGTVSNTAIVSVSVNATPVAVNDTTAVNQNGTVAVQVVTNDTDPDGYVNAATVAVTTNPLHGSVTGINTTTGAITYAPATGFYGLDTLQYTIKDNNGATSNPAFVYINVNARPVAVNDTVVTPVNSGITINVVANDTDPDGTVNPSTVTIVTQPVNGQVQLGTTPGTIVYTPNTGFTGIETFTYTIRDNKNASATSPGTVRVIVDAPPVANNDNVRTNINAPVSISVAANDTDPDGTVDTASISITGNPAHGTLQQVSGTGTYVYTPATGYTGADSYTYTIKDDRGVVSDTGTVAIQVSSNPVAVNDDAAVNQDSSVVIAVTGNDTNPDGTLNPATVTVVTQPAYGTVTPGSVAGALVYRPNPGYYGSDNFTYTVANTYGAQSNAATVAVTVNGRPVAVNDNTTTNEHTPVSIPVLANDTDPEGNNTISVSTVTTVLQPSHGTAVVNTTTGNITYTPADGYHGTDVFTYFIKDNNGAVSDTATVTIGINAQPIAVDDDTAISTNQAAVIAVLANDSDPDGTLVPTSVTISTPPQHGTATPDSDGTITYTPTAGYIGNDAFSYTVTDNNGAVSTPANVAVTVNDVPVAVNDNLNANGGATTVLNVLANDVDPGNNIDPSTVTIVTSPSHGVVTVNGDGTINYTPIDGYNGTDQFSYKVSDANGFTSNVATVIVTVNARPVAVNDIAATNQHTAVSIPVLANDSDPSGSALNTAGVTVVQNPPHGNTYVDPSTGNIVYTPDAAFYGIDTFRYAVKDNLGAVSDTALVTVNINARPVAVGDTGSTTENTAVSIDVTANDTDADGTVNKTTVVITAPPQHGTVNADPVTGVVTYTPNAGYAGTDNFGYQVQDNLGAISDPAPNAVTIVINGRPVANNDNATSSGVNPVAVDVTANDADPYGTIDKTTVTIVTAPAHGTVTVDPVTGVVTYTANAGYSGPDNFTYTVRDNQGTVSLPGTVSINVNQLPVAVADSATITQEAPLAIDVTANDYDNDGTINKASVVVITQPAHGAAATDGNGNIIYQPATGYYGNDTLTYAVSDNLGAQSLPVPVIININARPVVVDDSASTVQDTSVAVNVTANDYDVDGNIDVTTVTITQEPLHGSATVNPLTGVVTYIPNPGYVGNDVFKYSVRDDDGAVSTGTANVTIGILGKPIAVIDNVKVTQNGSVAIDVSANDIDPDGSVVNTTVQLVTPPAHGTATLDPATGIFTYTPNTGYTGADQFTYTIKDNNGIISDPGSVSINVLNLPVAHADTATTNQGTPVVVPVLANDIDVDGTLHPATVTVVTGPQHGTVSIDTTTGNITYLPAAGYNGPDNFTYTISDYDNITSLPGIVTITVLGKPVANADNITIPVGAPVTFDVTTNDTDPSGNIIPATVSIVQQPQFGNVSVNATTGLVTYTPSPGYNGTDNFTYTIRDNKGQVADPGTVTVNVNRGPVALSDPLVSTTSGVPVTSDVLANDSDPDGTLLPGTVTVATPPAHGTTTVDPNTGKITYTPAPGFVGTDSLLYTVKDDKGLTSSPATVIVKVFGKPIAGRDSTSTDPSTPVTVNVLFNDVSSGVQLAKGSLTVSTAPLHGTTTVDTATGKITYTPAAGFSGNDSLYYTIADANGAVSDPGTLIVTVFATNMPPVAVADTVSTNINTPVIIGVLNNDNAPGSPFDAGSITIIKQPVHGFVSLVIAGTPVYTPATGYTGIDSFSYTVKDQKGLVSNVAGVVVNVSKTTSGPVANRDGGYTTVNIPVVIDVLANDTDDGGMIDKTTVTLTSQPAHGTATVDPVTGKVTYTPEPGFAGIDNFSYTVKDTSGLVSNNGIIFTYANQPPVAVNDTVYTTINVPKTFNVTVNDKDADGVVNNTSVAITTQPAHGTVAVNATSGLVTYTPQTGYSGPDQFNYTVRDDAGALSNIAAVVVTVNATNTPPVANNDNVIAIRNTPRTIDVTTNDTDIDGTVDKTTVAIVGQPAYGTATVNSSTGKVTYTPNTGYTGADQFTYTVKDNLGGASNVATVLLMVNATNTPPVANNDVGILGQNQIGKIDITANDVDADGDINKSTVVITRNPINGTLQVDSATGVVTYIPVLDFIGTDNFSYTVNDHNNAISNVANVLVIVTPANQPPVAGNDSTSTGVATPVAINVTGNDNDIDGNVLPSTVKITTLPQHGQTAVNPVTGVVTYTPAAGYNGYDVFNYVVSDNNGEVSNTATVKIAVGTISLAPVAAADTASTIAGKPVAISVLANDYDPDGTINQASVILTVQPVHGQVTVDAATGIVTYRPTGTYTGTDYFSYVVKDNSGNLSNPAQVVVNVNPVVAPVAVADTAAVPNNQPTVIKVTANDIAAPGATINNTTVTIVTPPAHGTVAVDPVNGAVTYTPTDPTYTGADSFTYTVKDNNGTVSAPGTVTVGLTQGNQPVAVADTVMAPNSKPTVINVTANDTATAGHTIDHTTVTIVTQPSHGMVTVDPLTGNITYTPQPGYTGADSFAYTVKDNTGTVSAPGTVTLSVTLGTPPVAKNDAVTTLTNTAVSVAVLANDNDPDGSLAPASVAVTSLPAHGSVSIDTATGNILYTPATGYAGIDSFHYTVSDNSSLVSNAATVVVTITSPSKIGIAKALSSAVKSNNGSYDITYLFTLTNYGTDTLDNVEVTDDLGKVFTGGSTIRVVSLVAGGALKASSLYDGQGNITLLTTGSSLAPGRTDTVQLKVNVIVGTQEGNFYNSATAEGTSAKTGNKVTDVSTTGLKPDPGGNGDVSPNTPTVVALTRPTLFIPNGFSPNGDGVNDVFVIGNAGNRNINMEVYNRWGNLVYKNDKYQNNWGGTCNQGWHIGDQLPEGTYFYIVTLDGKDKYVGYITLKR